MMGLATQLRSIDTLPDRPVTAAPTRQASHSVADGIREADPGHGATFYFTLDSPPGADAASPAG
jgi:hypothetical protein